jgi:multisubunit Na+/H+ antiporter MnhE subunit
MSRYLISVVLLVLVYALTLASFHPADLLIGLIISVAVLQLFRPLLENQRLTRGGQPAPHPWRRTVAFVPFLIMVLWEIIVGTWRVALVVLHLRPLVAPGIVSVPIGDRTPIGIAVFGLATTLAPGTVLLHIDWRKRVMLIHVLDASDPDAVRAEQAHFYERWQRPVFP